MGKIIKRSIEKDKLINELETNIKNGGRSKTDREFNLIFEPSGTLI